jgi:hypothetical protein
LKIQRIRQEKTFEEHSFAPKIDPVSRAIAESRRRFNKPPHERLIEFGQATEARKNLIRQMKTEAEKLNNTFTPKIDSV